MTRRISAAWPAARGHVWGSLLLGLLVTAIGALESYSRWPYAPFLWLHAALCLALPLVSDGLQGDRPARIWEHRRFCLGCLGAGIGLILLYLIGYAALLRAVGAGGDPALNLWLALKAIFRAAAVRHGAVVTYSAAFFLMGIWAPLGEELYYRGFLFRRLRTQAPFWVAALLSAALFGLRHALQLLYFLPHASYPIGAGVAYFVWAGAFGWLFAWMYERTGSIWASVSLHALNLLWAPVALFALFT